MVTSYDGQPHSFRVAKPHLGRICTDITFSNANLRVGCTNHDGWDHLSREIPTFWRQEHGQPIKDLAEMQYLGRYFEKLCVDAQLRSYKAIGNGLPEHSQRMSILTMTFLNCCFIFLDSSMSSDQNSDLKEHAHV
jgi:hypothetical protein